MTLLLLLAACGGVPDDALPTAAAERGAFAMTLSVPGELEAVKSEFVSAPNVKGTLKITYVAEEGAHVKAGDVLVEFDRSDLEKELESALSRLQIARTKQAQKQAQLAVRLASAQSEVTKAELELQRAKMRLTDSETVPRVERESARIDVEEYTLAVDRSKSSLESVRLEGEAELELLRLEAEEAATKVRQFEEQLGRLKIEAPADGLVILTEAWRQGKRGKVTVGDAVWPGNPLMELPDLAKMHVEAWVHEVDASLVKVGQKVSVIVDAIPEPAWPGVVERVADLAVQRKEESTVKHVKVIVGLDRTDAALKPGMTVRAEVLVDEVPDALTVPREAVFYEGPLAYVWRDGLAGWDRAAVKLGATNDSHVVVVEGLETGDRVALADPVAFGRGERPGAGSPTAGAGAGAVPATP